MTNAPTDTRATARRRWLIAVSMLTLAATAWTALQTDDAAPAPPRSRAEAAGSDRAPRTRTSVAAATDAWPDAPSAARRPPWPAAAAPGLAAWNPPLSATPPAPLPAALAATGAVLAAAPQAPPFPYTLIGRLDDGEPRALLSSPLRSFGVKTTEVLDGTWRIDAVDAQGLTVTWLPAGLKKTIPFASS